MIVFLFMCLSLWAHCNQFKSKVPGGPHQYYLVWRPRWRSGVSDDGANTNRRRKRRGCGGEWRGRSAIRRPRKAEAGAAAAAARSDESWSLLITADSFIISTYWTQGEFTNSFFCRAAAPLRAHAHVCACVCVCPCMRTTFKVDFASGCQNDGFNPVRLDFPPSRIRLAREETRPRFPNYWQKQPYCNQTTLISLLQYSFVLTHNNCTWMRLLSASQQWVLRAHSWINEAGCWDVSGREAAESIERSSTTDRSLLGKEEGRNKETK